MKRITALLVTIYRRDGLMAAAVFLIAFVPRAFPPAGVFANVDAAQFWLVRIKNFVHGLSIGDPALLVQAPHPGLPLLWLGSLGEIFAQTTGLFMHFRDPVVAYLHILKLPLMLMTALTAAVGWLVWRRLFPRPLAVVVAILLALDPLWLVYSRYLHVDGLLIGWLVVGIPAIWLAVRRPAWHWTMLAAVMLTLAALTRINSFFFWMVGLSMLVWAGADKAHIRWRKIGVWVAASAVTALIVYPAIWLAPAAFFKKQLFGIVLGLSPHEVPMPADANPYIRPWFYPLFIITREFPAVILLAISGLVMVLRHRGDSAKIIRWLVGSGLGYLVFIFIAAKKMDRYALPLIIPLAALAGYAAVSYWQWFFPRYRQAVIGVAGLLVVVQLGLFYRLGPYFQTYENLIGRGLETTPLHQSAVFQPAWGEGVYQAASYLRGGQATMPPTAAWLPTTFCVYGQAPDRNHFPLSPLGKLECPFGLRRFAELGDATYLVLARDMINQNQYPELQADIKRLKWQPEKIISLNGIPYLWIYRNLGGLRPAYHLLP